MYHMYQQAMDKSEHFDHRSHASHAQNAQPCGGRLPRAGPSAHAAPGRSGAPRRRLRGLPGPGAGGGAAAGAGLRGSAEATAAVW